MARTCNKCEGTAEPAAHVRTFEYLGQTVRCLALVSSCVVCGFQWEDDTYDVENAAFVEQAQAAVLDRLRAPGSALEGHAARH